jgi:hypothetical protein
MLRMSTSHIAVLLAIGAIVPMQVVVSRPGLAETLGNADALGFAAMGISDSDAGPAHASAIGGIAVGPDAQAFTSDAAHPCTGDSDRTDCGHGNIAIGISSGATNDFAVAVGFLSKAGGLWPGRSRCAAGLVAAHEQAAVVIGPLRTTALGRKPEVICSFQALPLSTLSWRRH